MGRNKDQKARRKNAPGVARELEREQRANDPGPVDGGTKNPGDGPDKDCPTCGVVAGEHCKTASGKKAQKTHAARLK